MTTINPCKARRCNDQMQCGRCGLAWDADDEDRPPCRTARDEAMGKIREVLSGGRKRSD